MADKFMYIIKVNMCPFVVTLIRLYFDTKLPMNIGDSAGSIQPFLISLLRYVYSNT